MSLNISKDPEIDSLIHTIYYLRSEVLPKKQEFDEWQALIEGREKFQLPTDVPEMLHSANILCTKRPELTPMLSEIIKLITKIRGENRNLLN